MTKITWQRFFNRMRKAYKGPKGRIKAYAVRKNGSTTPVPADAIFLEIERGKGIYIDLARRPKDGLCVWMWAWPAGADGLTHNARFIQKACCSNLTELGIEVKKVRKEEQRAGRSTAPRRGRATG